VSIKCAVNVYSKFRNEDSNDINFKNQKEFSFLQKILTYEKSDTCLNYIEWQFNNNPFILPKKLALDYDQGFK